MGSSSSLTRLQRELLEAFFTRTPSFFLSGGAALAGFYLGHRETKYLDLFATPEVDIEEGVRALRSATAAIGASLSAMQESPDFRRFRALRDRELTLVDLVIDRAPQLRETKSVIGAVRLDPIERFGANKVCALLGRAELRDLVDLKALIERGHRLEELLADARTKEGGVEPPALAWVLSELRIGPESPLPPGTTVEALDAFRRELVDRLTRAALPPD